VSHELIRCANRRTFRAAADHHALGDLVHDVWVASLANAHDEAFADANVGLGYCQR
jgi:hypothetical protein